MARRSSARLHIQSHQSHLRAPRKRFEAAIWAAFRLAGKPRRSLSLVLVDDREIRRLHRQFFDLDTVTDVISFPLEDAGEPGEELLGEVVLSAQTAVREASRRRHPRTFEATLYAVHGTLHLLGFDDHEPAERAAMRQAERRCLKAAGIDHDLRVDPV